MAESAQIMLDFEDAKRRKWRNITIGLVLAALVVLFYVVTIVKLSVNIAERLG